MYDDLHKLKTIRCGGVATFQIPDKWTCDLPKKVGGAWACYDADDNDETVTLWINVDFFRWRDDGGPRPDPITRESLKTTASMELNGNPKEDTVSPVEQGYLRYRIDVDVSNGELVRCFRYYFFLAYGTDECLIVFNLEVVQSTIDDPKIQNLIKIIDREVRVAWLDPFGDMEEEFAKQRFGELAIYNCDDILKLTLPEATNFSYEGDPEIGEYLWYYSLEMEPTRVSMWISVENMDALWEDGEPREFDFERDNIEETLAHLVSDEKDRVGIEVKPAGLFGYDRYDDTDPPSLENADIGVPLKVHRWGYLRYSGNSIRAIRVVLMLPFAQKDAPLLSDLVAYLHRAVRRAKFPNFEEAANLAFDV